VLGITLFILHLAESYALDCMIFEIDCMIFETLAEI